MAEPFDPYHRWLGIPPKHQPADYYRLLGIERFESDREVIRDAADRHMAHVRTYQLGECSALSQKILNELAAARACLLTPEKKAAYDAKLREQLVAKVPPAAPAVPGPISDFSAIPSTAGPVAVKADPLAGWAAKLGVPAPVLVAVSGGAALLLIGVLIWSVSARRSGNGHDVPPPRDVAAHKPTKALAAPAPLPPPEPTGREHSRTPKPPALRPAPDEKDYGRDKQPQKAEEPAEPMTADADEATPPEESQPHEPGGAEPGNGRLPEDEIGRKPVPDSPEQQKVRALLDETFDTASAQTSDQQLTLSSELAALAEKADDATERFVLLRRASELASEAGDARRMLELVASIAEEFEVDRLLAQAIMLDTFAKRADDEQRIRALVDASAGVVDEALAADRFDLAGGVSASVYQACLPPAPVDPGIRAVALARSREIEELHERWKAVQAAHTALEANPEDEAAHTLVGQWYWLARGDWERALPHLAKGSDPRVQELAGRELNDPPDDAMAQAELGDAWWQLAEASHDPMKQQAQARAVHWYKLAQPNLSGLRREMVGKRVDALAGAAPSAAGAPETEELSKGVFAGRSDANRARLLAEGGGSTASETAVALALEWFANHQLPDGGWSFDHTLAPSCQGKCGNPGTLRDTRNSATAMALLAFLGAGHTHRTGKHRQNVQAGLHFLINNMKLSNHGGSFHETGGSMYSHGLAAIALTEAYGMTQDRALLQPAQAVVNYICYAQDPVGGGWRYSPRQAGDTSVMAWQMAALKTGQMGGLQVRPQVLGKASQFLDHVQAESGAKYGYTGPGSGPATTAIGLLCRMYLGWNKDNPALQRGVEWISNQGVSTGGNMYYNYYATQVARHWEGDVWKKWNDQMHGWLVNSQVKQGHEAGSWHFRGDGHGERGGRHYITSMATLMLQAYYRHPAIYGTGSAK